MSIIKQNRIKNVAIALARLSGQTLQKQARINTNFFPLSQGSCNFRGLLTKTKVMKSIFTLSLLIVFSFSAISQWKINIGYSGAIPRQEMSKNIQTVHSLQAGIMYQLPVVKQLSLGLEAGYGSYASKRIDQTFQFDNNVSSVVPVNYNSNAFNINFNTRLNLLSDKYKVIPYITAKGGLYNFFSTIYIEDPHDDDGCKPLERDNIINDKTLYWSAGGGVQIDPVVFSKKKNRKSIVLIDLGANMIRGGSMDYINTKELIDAQTAGNSESKPLNVRFVNASTQSIHEHTVAQVYTSPLRLLEFRAGIVLKLGKQ